jgi:hypothetical protein
MRKAVGSGMVDAYAVIIDAAARPAGRSRRSFRSASRPATTVGPHPGRL